MSRDALLERARRLGKLAYATRDWRDALIYSARAELAAWHAARRARA